MVEKFVSTLSSQCGSLKPVPNPVKPGLTDENPLEPVQTHSNSFPIVEKVVSTLSILRRN